MIKLQNLTPEVYYKQSRDFQFIGRLFDVVLNSVKTNAALINAMPLSENSDRKLIDLLTLTLGFKPKHNHYNTKQLVALCNTFCTLLKHKGSKLAVETAANALIHADGIKQEAICALDETNTNLVVVLPAGFSDLTLFKDILNYILPAGISCSIIRTNTVDFEPDPTSELTVSNSVTLYNETGEKITDRHTYAGTDITTISKIPQLNTNASESNIADMHVGSSSVYMNSMINKLKNIDEQQVDDSTSNNEGDNS